MNPHVRGGFEPCPHCLSIIKDVFDEFDHEEVTEITDEEIEEAGIIDREVFYYGYEDNHTR